MTNIKKFGTFAGVFTPSLLTILGVIMYLRLGWVVGEAGLLATIVIIILAHIISITTGLSISSVATDKKIKTGGVYYMLSRSLGFPIGGSIGITLYVGTALSIALYIIGFSESFLGIEAIANFLHLGQNVESYRIMGSAILILLVVLAFISTSLAIKSQFLVLGAIALSLLSIVTGIFINTSFTPATIIMNPSVNNVPFITLFAIFFPAVTGFTAGVAMSGDLKDPKSAIPKGTMISIGVGFIIYVSLALLFGLMVDRNLLLSDSNFLLKIALWSPLVIAGIWGATLSSALGGILGGPRILQAIAMDKIAPSFLSKASKKNNEPRNALIFTFLIAEAGILIGELNAIAEIVSMFYIAAYGFINIAFTLESWASTDFRPTFRVPKWIGILGFLASFGVMSQINPVAMIAAFLIMFSIYFLLKRKELKSESGDVWGSFWMAITRLSLNKLQKRRIEERNWKPNILLFNGDESYKTPQLQLGHAFAGKFGFLSIFNLIKRVNKNGAETNSFYNKTINEVKETPIFEHQRWVDNIFDGILQISETHGFSGIEPNTVMMGWDHNTKDPEGFTKLLKNLYQLDMNILMMDYDSERKFGKYKNIDIWWIGEGKNGNLALQLMKFLWLNDNWRQAKLRLLIVNPVNAERDIITKKALDILNRMRIKGELKIINNQVEKRSFHEIVQIESVHSDLIFMGIPEFENGNEIQFIEETNKLCKNIGTVVLVKASTFFKSLQIGVSRNAKPLAIPAIQQPKSTEFIKPINNQSTKIILEGINQTLDSFATTYIDHLMGIEVFETLLFDEVQITIDQFLSKLNVPSDIANFDKFQNQLSTTESLIINRLTEIYNNYIKDTPTEKSSLSIQQSLYEEWIELTTKEMRQFASTLPKTVKIILTATELQRNENDKLLIRWFKFRNRLVIKLGKETIYYNLKLRKIFNYDILPTLINIYFKNIQNVSNNGYAALVTLRSLINKITHIFYELKLISPNSYDIIYVKKRLDTIKQLATQSGILLAKQKQELFDRNSNINVTITNSLASRIDKIHPNVAKYKTQAEIPSIKKQIAILAPAATATYQCKQMLINNLILNNTLLITKNRITIETLKIKKTIEQEIKSKILIFQYDFKETLTKLATNSVAIENDDIPILKEIANNQTKSDFSQINYDALSRAHRRLKHWIETFPAELELLDEESYNNLTNNKFGRIGSIKIATKPLINFMVDREYIEPIKQLLSTIPERISSVNKILSNYVRLIDYSNIGKTEVSPEDSEQTDLFSITDLLNELNAEIVQSEQFLKKTIYSLESTTSTITGKLDVYPFLDAAQNIRQYIREKKLSPNRTGSLEWVKNSLRPAREQFAQLILSQSKGILFTRSFFKEENTYSLPEKLMAEYQQSHIKPEVQKKLSFYYKHLFVGKQNYALDFLIGREEELKKIDNYIVNHRSGFRNALLIAGERHSGKTFLANVMADKYVERKKVFTILPPEVGSTNFNDFNLAVGNAFNNNFNAEYNFSRTQNGTMIIIENAELWWAKENGGEKTLTTILNLTQKYRNSIVFVFTINSLALGIIKNVVPINRYFSSIVECSPMNASQIGKVILNRHNIGNMRFVLNGKREHHFRTWNYAKLFNRYFLISDGNIGCCLHIWINNILSVNIDKIQIQTPKIMDNSVFGSLSAQQKLVLLNIVIHTSVTVKTLSQLLKTTTKIAEENLNELQTLGLVVKTSVGIYKIDSIAHHRIVKYFKQNNII